jgi:hypothetical protein
MSSIENLVANGIGSIARYRATLLLAASLLLVGGASGFGAAQLRGVISREARTIAIATICPSLEKHEYDTLAAMVDPAPVAPLATRPFSPRTFIAQLRIVDQREGGVTHCSWRPALLGDETTSYHLLLRRPHIPVSIDLLVVLRHEPDNSWRISRSSPFTSDPV